MPTFRVHHETENGGKDSCIVHADNPTDAANIVRRNFPGVIITKTKLDRSGGIQNGKSRLANEIAADFEARGFKVFRHRQELVPQADMIGTDGKTVAAVNIVNGRNGTVTVDAETLEHWRD